MSKIKHTYDVIKKLRSLADSIETLVADEKAPPKSKSKANKPSDTKEDAVQQPTLEEVRAIMAEKNREGHREEIKAIILKYGANKLTALDPEHYPQVLKEVGEIK